MSRSHSAASLACVVAFTLAGWAACGLEEPWSSGSLTLLGALSGHQPPEPPPTTLPGALPTYVSDSQTSLLGLCAEVISDEPITGVHGYLQVVGLLPCRTGSAEAAQLRGCDNTMAAFMVHWPQSGLTKAAFQELPKVPIHYRRIDCATLKDVTGTDNAGANTPGTSPLSELRYKSTIVIHHDVETASTSTDTGLASSGRKPTTTATRPVIELPVTIGSTKPMRMLQTAQQGAQRVLLQNPDLPSQRAPRAPSTTPAPAPSPFPSPVPSPTPSANPSPSSSPAPAPTPSPTPSRQPSPAPSPTPQPSPSNNPTSGSSSSPSNQGFSGPDSKPGNAFGLFGFSIPGLGSKPSGGWGIGGIRPGRLLRSSGSSSSMQGPRRVLLQNPDLPTQRTPRPPSSNPTPAATPAPAPNPTPAPASNPTPAPQLTSPTGSFTPTPSTPTPVTGNDNGAAPALGAAVAYDGSAGGLQPGWSDASYNARPFTDYTPAGMMGGSALCKILPKGAALALQWSAGNTGALFSPFVGKRALELWVYKGSSVVAPLDVTIVSHAQGDACNSVNLLQGTTSDSSNGWVKFGINLSEFDRRGASMAGDILVGCSNQGAAGDLYRIELRNWSDAYDALICIDKLRLVA